MSLEEIARFYTRSRRFPKLIGRMNDGSRIWGGPYTMTQVVGGGFAFVGAMVTRPLWATDAMLLDFIITAGITGGVIFLLGLIPITRRNLVSAFMDAVSAIFQPVEGRYQGKVPRIRRPHQVHGTALVLSLDPEADVRAIAPDTHLSLEAQPATPATPVEPEPVLALSASPRVPVSAVERLLQQAKSTTKETN